MQITSADSQFPELLSHLRTPPARLYVRGQLADLPLIAVVGTRRPTAYGHQIVGRIVGQLCRLGFGIVSGLAFGIDALAHRAALTHGGYTIAVLPAGVQRPLPSQHTQLADDIARSGGALVSEHPDGSQMGRYSFVERNRIIAGLAVATVVIEAAEKSGSLHTARFAAADLGREVFAVPGSILSEQSVGCNHLIGRGATPALSGEQIAERLGYLRSQKGAGRHRAASLTLTESQRLVTTAIDSGCQDIPHIIEKTGLAPYQVTALMTELEVLGAIDCVDGVNWATR